MAYSLPSVLRFKNTFLVALAILGSVYAHGQSKETLDALKVADDADDSEMTKVDTSGKCGRFTHAVILSADLGGASVMSKANGATATSHGMSWAFGVQYAHKFNCCCCCCANTGMFLSYGLEIRNFNSVVSNTDWQGATAYDNLHYWYAGIPVVFHIVNTSPESEGFHHIRYYAQAGFTFSGNVYTNNVYSDQGDSKTYDLTKHYTAFMFRPFLTAGVTLHSGHSTYLLGPYVGYDVNNIITSSNFNEHILDFGLRFTTFLLK